MTPRIESLLSKVDSTRSLFAFLAGALLTAAGVAAQVPSDSLFKGFEPTPGWLLEIDGVKDDAAEIYQKAGIGFLVLPSKMTTPFLLVPRTQAVQTVHIMKIAKQPNGSLDLLADATLDRVGALRIEESTVSFDVDGRRLTLKEKPPLLGLHPAAALADYSADYAQRSKSYEPDGETIKTLKSAAEEVQVRVYFGSWCPFCQQYVPRMMRVAEQLDGSKVKIDFYGLPHEFSNDPVAGKMGVKSVPTGVVFKGGKEVGRIQGDQWVAPERALERIVG